MSNNFQQRGLISSDVNNDGKLDLLVANPNYNSIKLYLAQGNGQFTVAAGSPISISGGPIYIAIADFNGDSFLDLATANYYSATMSVLLGNGLGSFTNAIGSPYNTSGSPYCIDVADYNLDGKTDLITSCVGTNQVFVFHGSGIGTFTLASGFPMSTPAAPYHVSTGFFNSDIYPDFATANGISNNVSVFLGSSNGVFTNAPGSPFPVGNQPRTIAAKDMNNNGSVDLVVTNLGSSDVHVLLSAPNGSFTNAPGSPKSVGSAPYQSTIADFNLDGNQDVIVTNNLGNSISVLLGSGSGSITISPSSGLSIGSEPQPICNGDFNGDGKFDIALGDWNGVQINVLLNQTPVGINSINSDNCVDFYPNPTKGEVEFRNVAESDDFSLKLYDVFGHLQFSAEVKYYSNKINLDNLSQGLYFYRLVGTNGKLKTGQIVIEK